MDLKRLRTFVAVAERGTVSKAAEALHITQPALSRQIASLEQEFGFTLFKRVGRRLLMTARGEQLLGDCRSLLKQATALNERARILRGHDVRVLRVAASSTAIAGMFPAFLSVHAKHFPDIKLTAIEANVTDQSGLLESGAAQLAINVANVVPMDDSQFGCWPLPPFNILAATPRSLPIHAEGEIDIHKLVEHPLLLLKPIFATRRVFDAACHAAGVQPNVRFEGSSAHGLLALAEGGHGIAVVPRILPVDPRGLRIMRISHHRRPLEIAPAVQWMRRYLPQQHAEDFCRLLTAHLDERFCGSHLTPTATAQ